MFRNDSTGIKDKEGLGYCGEDGPLRSLGGSQAECKKRGYMVRSGTKAFQCGDGEMDPEMGVRLVGQRTCGHSWGRGGRMNWELGIDIYTLLRVK